MATFNWNHIGCSIERELRIINKYKRLSGRQQLVISGPAQLSKLSILYTLYPFDGWEIYNPMSLHGRIDFHRQNTSARISNKIIAENVYYTL
jgi:hypothetical protein